MGSFRGSEGVSKSRRVTFALFAVSCLSLIAAVIVGVNDNPPGLLLCYIAVTALILAFVHGWRQTRRYLLLLGASAVGFPVFVVLHNLLYGLGMIAGDVAVLAQILGALEVAFFLAAVMLCPPGFLIGAIGSVLMWSRHSRRA